MRISRIFNRLLINAFSFYSFSYNGVQFVAVKIEIFFSTMIMLVTYVHTSRHAVGKGYSMGSIVHVAPEHNVPFSNLRVINNEVMDLIAGIRKAFNSYYC